MGSGFLGIGERGFTMGKSSKRLFLDNLSMDYEKGIITGSLGDEN